MKHEAIEFDTFWFLIKTPIGFTFTFRWGIYITTTNNKTETKTRVTNRYLLIF